MRAKENGVPAEDLLKAVKDAVQQANVARTDPGRDLRVTEIQLTLNVVTSVDYGGRVEFQVPFIGMKLSIGRNVTKSDTQTIDVTLVPPDLREYHEVRAGVEDVLVKAIQTVRSVVAAAADGDEPFVLKTSSVELEFAVTEEGSITLGFEGKLSDEITHTLRLSLEPPSSSRS